MTGDKYLRQYLERFPCYRIAVIGDLMLDRYIVGKASRISEEAPVPVVKVSHETHAMGGAANVVANLLSLGSKAAAFGFVGSDVYGQQLKSLMIDAGAGVEGVISHPDRETTVKTRVLGNHQQVVRIDHENSAPCKEHSFHNKLREQILDALKHNQFDAVIFEDYAKGLLDPDFIQEINDTARNNDVLTLLDPHPGNNFQTKNLCALTPNRSEAFGLAGRYHKPGVMPLENDKPLLETADILLHSWGTDHLLITLGSAGMALFSADHGSAAHIPTKAQAVYDVSGAGDTVTATFLLALLAGAQAEEAARLANHAAGIVVGKVGTLPVAADELYQNLEIGYGE